MQSTQSPSDPFAPPKRSALTRFAATMKRAGITPFALKVGLALLLVIVVMALVAKVLSIVERDSAVIAWVQAIGGVLSIFAAWLIGRNSEVAAAKARDQQRRILLEGTRTCAKQCVDTISRLDRAFTLVTVTRSLFLSTYDATAFEVALRSLRSVPFHDLGDYALGKAILDLETVWDRTKQRLDEQEAYARHRTEGATIDVTGAMRDSTLIFNHAASVERRAAELLDERARF